jgi:hypothetical protein
VVAQVTKVEMTFLQQWRNPGRVAGGGGADSMLRFWLERGGDGTMHCHKMKQRE